MPMIHVQGWGTKLQPDGHVGQDVFHSGRVRGAGQTGGHAGPAQDLGAAEHQECHR